MRPLRKHPIVFTFIVGLVLLPLGILLTGCAGGGLTRPVTATRTVDVPERTVEMVQYAPQPPTLIYVTNTVAGEPVVITNVIERPPIVVTNTVVLPATTEQVTVTNGYAPDPRFTAGIESARRLNAALNPTPTSPLVDWGLTALGGIATIVAGWQTRRLQRERDLRKEADAVIDTVVKAVETYPGREVEQVKAHIHRVSQITDVAEELDRRVQTTAAGLVQDALADGRMTAAEFLSLAQNPLITEADLPENFRPALRKLRA